MHPMGDMGIYCFVQGCFKFVPKIISDQCISVGVYIFTSHVEFSLSVGFPVVRHFTSGLGMYWGLYKVQLTRCCGRISMVKYQLY